MASSRWNAKRLIEHFITAILVFSVTSLWRLPAASRSCSNDALSLQHPSFPLAAVPPNSSVVRPTTFLLGIFSMLDETKSRQLMRSTMMGYDLPPSTKSRLCSLQEYLAIPQLQDPGTKVLCQLIYTFVIGGNPTGPTAYPEGATDLLVDKKDDLKESDVILLNIKENMNDGKTPSWFHYASTLLESHAIDYVSKLDLDTLVSLPQLLDFVNHELPSPSSSSSPSPPRVFGGLMMDFEACGGKFWKGRCDPAKHKVYMSGQFYFCSHDIVRFQSQHRLNETFKQRKHEDLNFGVRVWGYPHPIKIVALNPNYFWIHGLKNESLWMEGYNSMKHNRWKIQQRFFVNDVFKPPEILAAEGLAS